MKVEINKKALGQRIKSIRQKKGLTLEEFGKIFGAEKSVVSRWENGKTIPNAERLKTISIIGDYDMNELLYGDILHFIYDYLETYLPTEKKYLRKHTPIYEYQNLKDEIDSKNISYTDIEKINPILDEMICKTEKYFQDTVIKYKNEILKNIDIQKETFNKTYNEYNLFRERYSNLSEFIEDISTDSEQHLSDISKYIQGFYDDMMIILNKDIYFYSIETSIILMKDFIDKNYDFDSCKYSYDQISIMKNKSSIEDYDRVVTIYNELDFISYSIAWYDNKQIPLIEGKKYLFFWVKDTLEIGTYVKHGSDEKMVLSSSNTYVPINKIDFYGLLLGVHC